MRRHALGVATLSCLLLLAGCSSSEAPAPVAGRPAPVGWIHDGLRLFRYDSAQGTLQRVRLPGSSLPLDDGAPGETTGLEAAAAPTALQRLVSSPSGRYLAYTLEEGDRQHLLAFDVDRGTETDLGLADFWGMGFATGRDGLLLASPRNGNDYTMMTLADLAYGAVVPIPVPLCDSFEAGGLLMVRVQVDGKACGDAGPWQVLALEAGQIVTRPLQHPWTGREVFFSDYAAVRAGDGSFLTTVYLRDATGDQEYPVALCRLDQAHCEQVLPRAWIDNFALPLARPRSLSWDGRTRVLMTEANGNLRVEITEDGYPRTVDPGHHVHRARALEGARGVLLLASLSTPDDPNGYALLRVDPGEAPRTVWRDPEREYWNSVDFDVSEDGSRLMLTEFEEVTGTDVMYSFPVAVRGLDDTTGTLGTPLAGGGAPVLVSPDLKHVLIARDLGPGGFELLDADPATGAVRPLVSWEDPPDGVLRLASDDCDRLSCPLPRCLTRTPVTDHASVTWDGRTDAFEVTLGADVVGQSTLANGNSETLLRDGDGVVHRLVLDLPAPHALPVHADEHVTLHLKQALAASGAPGQYLILWDAADTPRAVFVGGTLKSLAMAGTCGDRECPAVSLGNTECAPEPVPGCGRRLHPPAVVWWPSQGWSWQVEPGADPMGWPLLARAFATDKPLDGGCEGLPSDRAWVWMEPVAPEPRFSW